MTLPKNASKEFIIMSKRSKGIIAGSITVFLMVAISSIAASASNTVIRSHGRIVFDNNTEDVSDDVIFDARDLDTIDDMVAEGKQKLISVINTYLSTSISGSQSFDELASSITAVYEEGYIEGKKSLQRIELPLNTTIDIKNYADNWQYLSEENFSVEVNVSVTGAAYGTYSNNHNASASYSYVYDASTGILTIVLNNKTAGSFTSGVGYITSCNLTLKAVYLYN